MKAWAWVQWLSKKTGWEDPTRRFKLVQRGLALAGVASLIATRVMIEDSQPRDLLASLGEGLLITFVIASIVEPYLRRSFIGEVGGDTIWQLINPDAPADFRAGMVRLVAARQYIRRRESQITFDWENRDEGVLRVSTDVLSFVYNSDDRPFRFERPVWILDSCDDYVSRYDAFEVRIDGADSHLERDSAALAEHMTTDADGTVYVELPSMLSDFAIPPRSSFSMKAVGTMYRHQNGYLPLVQSYPTLRQHFTIGGNATSDLDIRLLSPRGKSPQRTVSPRTGEDATFDVDWLMLPGQVLLFSWRPRGT